MKKSSGFTLIELLVVILIISIVTTATLLTLSVNQDKQIESIGNQLTNLLLFAEEEAILRGKTFRLTWTAHSYKIEEYHVEKKSWEDSSEKLFQSHALPHSIQLELKTPVTTIVISPNGNITPFILHMSGKNKKFQYQITAEESGNITHEIQRKK